MLDEMANRHTQLGSHKGGTGCAVVLDMYLYRCWCRTLKLKLRSGGVQVVKFSHSSIDN